MRVSYPFNATLALHLNRWYTPQVREQCCQKAMTLQAANKKMCIKHMLLNDWPMLNFNLQDIKINEKCINKLATCFRFTPGSHGQCVVKPHTAQSLYQILINYDPYQCLRKHRWLPESGIPPVPLSVKVKVVFLNFLVSIESLLHISEFTDDPCHPCLAQSQGWQASYQKLCRLP